jgi:hypothetical protein
MPELVITDLRIGQKVHYQPEYYVLDLWENGIIKEIREDELNHVWVVFNCAGQWKDYKNYTSAKTHLRDLKLGWKFEPNEEQD